MNQITKSQVARLDVDYQSVTPANSTYIMGVYHTSTYSTSCSIAHEAFSVPTVQVIIILM